VLVTRAIEQSESLVMRLRERSAIALPYPCLAIAPPADPQRLHEALRRLARGKYVWLILTSSNAANAVARGLSKIGATLSPSVRIAAVGPASGASARDALGVSVEIIPETNFTADTLATWLTKVGPGQHALLPQSELADNRLAAAMRSHGVDVEEVVAYRVGIGSGGINLRTALAAGEVDAITITSGSAAHGLVARLSAENGEAVQLRNVPVACIGLQTAIITRALGFIDVVAAKEQAIESLLDALATRLAERGCSSDKHLRRVEMHDQR
jgi:uroporphyrinogen-III synthase